MVGRPDHPSSSLVSDFHSWYLIGYDTLASRRGFVAFIYVLGREGAGPGSGGRAEEVRLSSPLAGAPEPRGGSLFSSGLSSPGRRRVLLSFCLLAGLVSDSDREPATPGLSMADGKHVGGEASEKKNLWIRRK